MKPAHLVMMLAVLIRQAGVPQEHGGADNSAAIRRLLSEQGVAPPEGEPVKCGLPAVFHALAIRREAGGERLQAVEKVLTRPVMQVSTRRGAFRVHYDTSGIDAPALLDQNSAHIPGTAEAFVDSIFSSLSYMLPFESVTLGYGPLVGDGTLGGGPEYDIVLMELGAMYGYTTPDTWPPEGGMSSTFITIDNDFAFVYPLQNRGLPALRVTLAHELHHALQIGNYGYWTDHAFFYEITSTWMEDVVYPDVDDYLNYLAGYGGHFRMPDKSFSSNDLIMYSRSLWGHFISKRYSRDVMRMCWEQVRSAPPLQAINNALKAQGSEFVTAFAEWTLWNLFTGPRSNPGKYYPDGADYPSMVQVPFEYVPPARDVSGSLAALGSRYYQVIGSPDTMTVILSNLDLAGAGSVVPPNRAYAYHFRSTRSDESYRLTPLGIYARLDVADLSAWSTWYVMGDTVRRNYDPELLVEGKSFPNPFVPGTHARVCLPVKTDNPVRGTLYVFAGGIDLVYSSASVLSGLYQDRQMFFWDGKDNDGRLVPSGVYVYVLELEEKRLRGKIAVVRK